MSENGFAKIRNGIRHHIKQGKLHPTDLGVYLYLHLECDWTAGIYHGTALGIAHGFDDAKLKNMIQKSLHRLREAGYINYREGKGQRRGYDILIDKFEPSFGARCGLRLNAWKHGEKIVPDYESSAVEAVVEPQLSGSKAVVEPPIPDLPDLPNAPDEPDTSIKKTPAETLAVQFFKMLGQPKKFRLAAGDWEKSISVLLENFTPEQLSSVIKFSLEDDDFILGYLNKATDPMATFVKNIDTIRASWETEEKVSAARAKKANKIKSETSTKTAPGAHGIKSGFKL
jgi:hypothetical protein